MGQVTSSTKAPRQRSTSPEVHIIYVYKQSSTCTIVQLHVQYMYRLTWQQSAAYMSVSASETWCQHTDTLMYFVLYMYTFNG